MEMKISGLTIILIICALVSIPGYFLNKNLAGLQSELCEIVAPGDMSKASESEVWSDCIRGLSDLSIRRAVWLISSLTFILLAILSWKVDQLSGRKP